MSIFSTTANTGFNSFANPLNPMNTNPGGWGVDPNYLTPSYTAPYRPSYGGQQGVINYSDPSFFRSANHIFNPFAAPPPQWGNPIQNQGQYFDSLANRPMDAAMSIGQSVVAPALATYAAFKMGSMTVGRVGGASSFSGVVASNWAKAWGGSASTVAAAGARQGIFAAAGASMGRGVASGIFGAANMVTGGALNGTAGMAARGLMTGAATAAGGVAGGLLLPLALAQGGMEVLQQGFFNPYAANALTSRTLRENFANQTLGTYGGNTITGRGLSRYSSAKIASGITSAGIKDYTLDEFSMGQIADLSSRSGLLDNASIDQISGKIKDIGKLVKLMMNLTNDPDIKNNIEQIVKLKHAGVSMGNMGSVMQSIGFSSSIAGVSTQRMMNTVGAQGQYLAQANGLMPIMGQLASANAMAGFASSYRTGLIKSSTLAMMGGVEGATQSLVSGQINAGQTMYNRISLYNQYMGGGRGNGVVGNLSNFGSTFASNPFAALGEMELNDGTMRSLQMKDRGVLAIQDQLMDIAKLMPRELMFNKNGKIDGNVAFTLMTKTLGMSSEEAKAALRAFQAGGDKETIGQNIAAIKASHRENVSQYLNQEGLGNGIANRAWYPARQLFKEMRAEMGGIMSNIQRFTGRIGDSIEKGFHSAVYGDSLYKEGEIIKMGGPSGPRTVKAAKFERNFGAQFGDAAEDAMDKINQAASGAHGSEAEAAANRYLNAKTESERVAALDGLVSAGVTDYSTGADVSKVLNSGTYGKVTSISRTTGDSTKLSSLLRTTIGDRKNGPRVSDAKKSMLIGQAHALSSLSDQEFASARQRYMEYKKDPSKVKKESIFDAFEEFGAGYGNASGSELRAKAELISMTGVDNGLISTSSNMYVTFGSTKNMMAALDRDPSAFLDPETLKKFKAGKDGLTGDKKEDFYFQAWAESTHQVAMDSMPDYIKGANKDVKKGLLQRYQATSQHMNQIWQLEREGKIDVSTALESEAVTRMDQAVNNFGFYVEKFGDKALGRNGEEVRR